MGVRREEGVIIMTCSALQLREGGDRKKEREGKKKKKKVKRNKGRKCRREKEGRKQEELGVRTLLLIPLSWPPRRSLARLLALAPALKTCCKLQKLGEWGG